MVLQLAHGLRPARGLAPPAWLLGQYMPSADNDTVHQHEWPTGSGLREPMAPDPTPLHEREPGLLDEEVLPLAEDWWRGPGNA